MNCRGLNKFYYLCKTLHSEPYLRMTIVGVVKMWKNFIMFYSGHPLFTISCLFLFVGKLSNMREKSVLYQKKYNQLQILIIKNYPTKIHYSCYLNTALIKEAYIT